MTTLLALCGISHKVAWHGQYYHITGTVWPFHISGMVRPILPHYWHRVTFPTLVAWYGQYYHITGTVWPFPTLVAWHGQYDHITGTLCGISHIKWHDTASMMSTLLAPCDHSHISGMVRSLLPHYWHRVAFPTLVAWYGQYDHITGTVWPFPH